MEEYSESIFLTLTYSDEKLPKDLSLKKSHMQLFFKNLRENIKPRKIKYYAVGEYGDENKRPHYHAIILGMSAWDEYSINNAWVNGFTFIGSVTRESIGYVTRYINKKLYGDMAKNEYGKKVPPFALMSKGMGKRWVEKNKDHLLINLGIRRDGKAFPMPRYYKRLLGDVITDEVLNNALRLRVEERERKRMSDIDTELAKWRKAKERQLQARLDSEFWENVSKRKL